jgi:hypothetical protein
VSPANPTRNTTIVRIALLTFDIGYALKDVPDRQKVEPRSRPPEKSEAVEPLHVRLFVARYVFLIQLNDRDDPRGAAILVASLTNFSTTSVLYAIDPTRTPRVNHPTYLAGDRRRVW